MYKAKKRFEKFGRVFEKGDEVPVPEFKGSEEHKKFLENYWINNWVYHEEEPKKAKKGGVTDGGS